jgi:2,4-dienoyl-CoA reductase-like NADH-dependent reductase (Old Yellow Enzyme family)
MTLARPYRFRGGAIAPNRAWLAPLTNQQSHDDGTLHDDELRWLARRAHGGFGVVETCASHVSDDGKAFDGQLGCGHDRHLPGLTRLAEAIRAEGALGIVQLHHGGARSPSRLTGQAPWSASVWHEDSPRFEAPRAATVDDLQATSDAFLAAAQRCARAGFHGVELHAAHGYLLSQFLSRTFNPRADGWGGDLPGRARLLRTITARVRAALPAPFVLAVRLSPEDFGYARGIDLDDSLQVARWLADEGVDAVHISLWDAAKNTQARPDAHPVPLFRAALPADVALISAGDVWTSEDAQRQLDLGADFVAVGRAAILDPDWPRHVEAPGFTPIRGPRTPEELGAAEVGPRFVTYLRRFRGLVTDP